MALAVFYAAERERELERETARQEAREQREQTTPLPPSSLYGECMRFAESTDGGSELLLKAVLYSEQWSRPPTEDVKAAAARVAWDYAMHHKTLAEYAIAEVYKLKDDAVRHAYHKRRAEIAYPRIFWQSDAFLEHAAVEIAREKTN